MFRQNHGTAFGCFAEALSLAKAIKHGGDFFSLNWFEVNARNMNRVDRLFRRDGFTSPKPRCYGKRVRDLSLDLEPALGQKIDRSVSQASIQTNRI
jgi:hypothetical protein